MKKVLFLAAATAAIVSSCSQSAESVIEDNGNNIETSQTPVNMSVYTASSTRAGQTGNITNAESLALKGGFGVFAYQTGSTNYTAGQKTFQPDFMYNQAVTGTTTNGTTSWTYRPIKYWPNDNTVADDARAKGETNTGKVSFFAYAPYADLSATDANKTSGIIAVSDNNAKSDPTVTYKLTTDGSANVDLLWGTAETNTSAAKTNGTTLSGSAQNGTTLNGGKAAVNVNLTKMKNSGKILFVFKHALAKFGGYDANTQSPNGILIKADPDITDTEDATTLGHITKITVKNITITTDGAGTTDNTGKQTLTTSGTLNLATGVWTADETNKVAATLKTVITADGTNADAQLNADIAEPTTTPSADSFFNGRGVQKSATNVYASETNPFVFIPGTKIPSMKVTVEYVVRTKDANVVNGYTTTTNKISKVISFGGTEGTTVEMNKRYSLTIILGLSGIKFDASVAGWDEGTTTTGGSGTSSAEVNLPINVADTKTAGSSDTTTTGSSNTTTTDSSDTAGK